MTYLKQMSGSFLLLGHNSIHCTSLAGYILLQLNTACCLMPPCLQRCPVPTRPSALSALMAAVCHPATGASSSST